MTPGTRRTPAGPWGMLEWFVLAQTMGGALLYLPGTQAIRLPIRSLPYIASLALLVMCFYPTPRQVRWFPGRSLLIAALVITGLGLLHPDANLMSGSAQVVFQISIAAAALWAERFRITPARLDRLVLLMFVTNAIGAVVGLLQVYDPNRFLPPEFSEALDEVRMNAMTYTGAEGRQIIRPCGLSDLPGAAAGAGAVTGVFGLILAARPGTAVIWRIALGGLASLGVAVVYLTQVRSVLLMTVFAAGLACYLMARQGRPKEAFALVWLGIAGIGGAFVFAVGIGGDNVQDRFVSLVETGAVESYKEQRGVFLEYTIFEAPKEFPLGAGVGRWGMMYTHFNRFDSFAAEMLWAEIQPTGWIYDGGVPLAIAYASALVLSCWGVYKVAVRVRSPLAFSAALILCSNLFVIGTAFAGPAFNFAAGIQYWFFTACLFAAASQESAAPTLRGDDRPQW